MKVAVTAIYTFCFRLLLFTWQTKNSMMQLRLARSLFSVRDIRNHPIIRAKGNLRENAWGKIPINPLRADRVLQEAGHIMGTTGLPASGGFTSGAPFVTQQAYAAKSERG
jgi:hypothetical protein